MTKTPYELVSGISPEEPSLSLSVQIRRDITHFSSLASVVEGLQSLDGLLRTRMAVGGAIALDNKLLEARARLVRFRVNSDPVADIIANNPWLSVLTLAVVVVRDYGKFRDSVALMKKDAELFVYAISGLSEHQQLHVVVGTKLLIDTLLEFSEDGLRTWVEKLARARRAISGLSDERPVIHVTRQDA